MHKITMLGTGLIGTYYARVLNSQRSQNRVYTVCSRSTERVEQFARAWNIPQPTTDMKAAIRDADTDVIVIGLPNHLHEEAVVMAAEAGKAILCTKPLGRNAAEAKRMLTAVEQAGVFHGYLEDLVYTPKTVRALSAVRNGALGRIVWTRSRVAHAGPHSDWFRDKTYSGGGAIIDLGCHCIDVSRSFIGRNVKPLEVMCWADTQVQSIDAEDNAVGLVSYASGAVGQFEVSWTFRGGMDLRDEISGTEGTIWLNHSLRTGIEIFTAAGEGGYITEKTENTMGWLFPLGDEIAEFGYIEMFADMFESLDSGKQPMEDFYDGYVVNAIMDAAYRSGASKRWEPVLLDIWRGSDEAEAVVVLPDYDDQHFLIKQEMMTDGRTKLILKDKLSGVIIQKVIEGS